MVLEIIVENCLILSSQKLKEIDPLALESLKQIFTYKNPKFIENSKWGRSNHDVAKFLYSYQIHRREGKMYISRGGLKKVKDHLKKFNVATKILDRTLVCESEYFEQSNTTLREDQEDCLLDMLEHEYGCGVAYTSFGKTVTMLEMIRDLKQPALVIVHTTFLQEQWIKEATDPKLFNLDPKDIGGVGGVFAKKKDFNQYFDGQKFEKRRYRKLNICLYHSLTNEEHSDFFKDRVGVIVFDEGQKSPIDDIQLVVNNFRAKYRYTMSAELQRKDGKEFLTFDTFGPVRHVSEEKESDSKILSKIFLIPSDYEDDEYDIDGNYTNMITRMALDRERNILICKRAIKKVRQGKFVIIFVERKVQAMILAKYLSKFKVDMLLGPCNWKDFSVPHLEKKWDKKGKDIPEMTLLQAEAITPSMMKIMQNYDNGTAYKRIEALSKNKELDIVIGTQKAEVGLNIRTLDHGVLTTPAGSNPERFKQIKGRLERTYSEIMEKFFGYKKPTPSLDVINDSGLRPSANAVTEIRNNWSGSVFRLKRRTKNK